LNIKNKQLNECYKCGEKITDENKHKEHIIQNAIGGTLKPDNILCENCGVLLNTEIDIPFVKIFENFSARLNIKKDRKSDIKVKGVLNDVPVYWNKSRIVPQKPHHKYDDISGELVIFAHEKTAKNYQNKITREIGKDNVKSVTIIDDLTGIGGIIKYPFTMDNKIFKKGLAKIAIGFASYHGVSRNNLKEVLDIENKSIKNELYVIPFYPLSPLEYFIEYARDSIDCEYPYHSILLYTHPADSENKKTLLVCYIELFCTFQHYIILSDDYNGDDVYECYAQKIFEKEDVKIGGRYSSSDIAIILDELGLKYDDIKDLKGDEFRRFIEQKYNQKKYLFDYEAHIDRVISGLLQLQNLVKLPDSSNFLTQEQINIGRCFNEYCEENDNNICIYKN
jgi:hypothetical protein